MHFGAVRQFSYDQAVRAIRGSIGQWPRIKRGQPRTQYMRRKEEELTLPSHRINRDGIPLISAHGTCCSRSSASNCERSWSSFAATRAIKQWTLTPVIVWPSQTRQLIVPDPVVSVTILVVLRIVNVIYRPLPHELRA